MALTVNSLKVVLSALPDDMEVWVETLNSEDADGSQSPVEVVETYQELNKVVLRDDF